MWPFILYYIHIYIYISVYTYVYGSCLIKAANPGSSGKLPPSLRGLASPRFRPKTGRPQLRAVPRGFNAVPVWVVAL